MGFVTVKHTKAKAKARVSEQALPIWKNKGWEVVQDDLPPDVAALPDQDAAALGEEDAVAAGVIAPPAK